MASKREFKDGRKEIRHLTDSRDDLAQKHRDQKDRADRLATDNATLRKTLAEREAQVAGLRDSGHHIADCPVEMLTGECNCRWAKALSDTAAVTKTYKGAIEAKVWRETAKDWRKAGFKDHAKKYEAKAKAAEGKT